MSLLVKPVTACNLSCEYCYEADLRNAGNHQKQYDLEAIKAAIRRDHARGFSGTPVLHGGEVTLIPIEDLEELCKCIYEVHGRVSIQTNATLITDQMIELFKKYDVNVGVSMDGPGDLNMSRWAGSEEATRKMTERIHRNIMKMRKAGINIGLIVVVNKEHMKPGNLDKLKAWILDLAKAGIQGGRLNFVQVDYAEVREKYELTIEEAQEFYREMVDFVFKHPNLYWQPMRDIVDSLMGLGLGTCFYTQCDVFATNGARIVQQDGSIANCMKTARNDGVMGLYADSGEQHHRSLLLRQVPHEYGGCNGCKWWRICHGHCPTEGFDFDWRNKSRYCEAYRVLYQGVYDRLKALMPNIHLVVDDAINKHIVERGICTPEAERILQQDYQERQAVQYRGNPFARMQAEFAHSPSSHRGSSMKTDPNCFGVDLEQRPRVNGYYHADHADAVGSMAPRSQEQWTRDIDQALGKYTGKEAE